MWNLTHRFAVIAGCFLFGLLLIPGTVSAGLEVGDPVPQFTAVDDQGQQWNSSEHLGKGMTVIYFYPADMTGGCTKQACGFRDDAADLKKAGVTVIGVSGDTPQTHRLFKKVHGLDFTLLADEKGEVAKLFGVPVKAGGSIVREVDGEEHTLTRGVTASRWTFLVGKDGRVAMKNENVNPAADSKAIQTAVEKQAK